MNFKSQVYVKMFTDMMSEGFIVIDDKARIQVYNRKAKEIFGIADNQIISHEEGKINRGDLVILADNALGQDDGNLTYKSLELLNIKDPSIGEGDSIIVLGYYKSEQDFQPLVKHLIKGHRQDQLLASTTIDGVPIEAKIDFIGRSISISLDQVEYKMSYLNAIGHMVVLDGGSMEMKFYQASGYTARGESINDLLKGGEFRAKGQGREGLDVIGRDIFQIHESDSMIQQLLNVAQGENISYVDEFEEINGIPSMCSLLAVEDQGKRIGAALKVEDISQIRKIIAERDYAISKLDKAESLLQDERALRDAFPNFIGNSQALENVKLMALKAAKTNSNVLILGESGTGKTILARAIHRNSRLKNQAFIHVNCGAIAESLLESELFGYEEGAFTGARSKGKKGLFEMAHGGTIFLDEIGDISQNLQVKLLQAIQEKSFYPVGGTERVSVDIRIIAATNKNLEEEMLGGRFREDLYYRINVFPIWIPPLRDRKQDIISLVDFLLPRICDNIGCKIKRISGEAIDLILRYNWPGNIRELENILERAVNLAEGNNILSKHIDIRIDGPEDNTSMGLSLKEYLEVQEKLTIERTLTYYKGDKKKTIEALDIGKTTFYEKLKKYNIG